MSDVTSAFPVKGACRIRLLIVSGMTLTEIIRAETGLEDSDVEAYFETPIDSWPEPVVLALHLAILSGKTLKEAISETEGVIDQHVRTYKELIEGQPPKKRRGRPKGIPNRPRSVAGSGHGANLRDCLLPPTALSDFLARRRRQ